MSEGSLVTALETPERWQPIPGFVGYEASDQGRIRSLDRTVVTRLGRKLPLRGQILKQQLDPVQKRLYVAIGRKNRTGVHRLVLSAFVGPCPEGMEGCHNNGNALDNRLTNLRWDTRPANSRDSVLHGTHPQASKTACPKGHPYDEKNTRIRPCGRRTCRACHREISKRSRIKQETRRLLAFVAAGAVLAGTGIGYATDARADGIISDAEFAYVQTYGAGAVCTTISAFPTEGGVMGVMQGIADDGFTYDSAVDIINASVSAYCPSHWGLLQAIGARARGETGGYVL